MHFSLFETLLLTGPTLLFGGYFLSRSARAGRYELLAFLGLMAYAFVLEFVDVTTAQNYNYSDLLLMIGRSPHWVPFEVPVSWAAIVYMAMRTSDHLGIPWRLRPVLDGVIALSLDLVIDPVLSASVAVEKLGTGCLADAGHATGGLGMWIWCVPHGSQGFWLGVPLTNFFGWFVVVALVSCAIRIGRERMGGDDQPMTRQVRYLAGSLLVVFVSVVVIMLGYERLLTGARGQEIAVALAVVAPLAIVARYRRDMRFDNRADMGVVLFAESLILPYGALFYLRGIDRASWPRSSTLLAGAILLVTLLVLLPYLGRRTADEPA